MKLSERIILYYAMTMYIGLSYIELMLNKFMITLLGASNIPLIIQIFAHAHVHDTVSN